MKYYAIPSSRDGCNLPTLPHALPLGELGKHLEQLTAAYQQQGYFSNMKRERIPVSELTFTIVSKTEYETPTPIMFGLVIDGRRAR